MGSAPVRASASRSEGRSGRSQASNFLPTRQSCGDGSEVRASSPTMRATSYHVATLSIVLPFRRGRRRIGKRGGIATAAAAPV